MEGMTLDFLNFSSYDTETWTTFLKDNWLVLAIALLVLIVVIRIVKTVVKWAFVAVIVIGLVLYSGYTLDDVKEVGSKVMDTGLDGLKELGTKVADSVKQEAVNAMIGEASEAKFESSGDGKFTIKTDNIEMKGEAGSGEVLVSLRGTPFFKLEVDGAVQSFIDQAKQNG